MGKNDYIHNFIISDNCTRCQNQCPPAKRLIARLKDEPWVASKALDFLYDLCKEEKG